MKALKDRRALAAIAGVLCLAIALLWSPLFTKKGRATRMLHRAEKLMSQGRPLEAQRELARALALNPSDARLHSAFGRALDRLEDPKAAYASFKHAAYLEPGDFKYNLDAARMGLRLGHLAEAQRFYQKAREIDPKNLEVLYQLGYSLALDRKFDEAREIFLKVLELSPEEAGAYLNLAFIHAEKGEMEEAGRMMAQAQKLAPARAMVYNELGNLHLMQGRVLEARALFEQALQIDPEFEDARANLEFIKRGGAGVITYPFQHPSSLPGGSVSPP